MTDLYIAVQTKSDINELNNKHVTISYMKTKPTKKLFINEVFPEIKEIKITDVQYWETANITVAIIHSGFLSDLQNDLSGTGFTYDNFDFIPHITICSGDKTELLANLVGNYVTLHNPYLRLRD